MDHPPGAKDDVANAVAGLICLLSQKTAPMTLEYLRSIIEQSRARAADPYRGKGEVHFCNAKNAAWAADIQENSYHRKSTIRPLPSPFREQSRESLLKTTLVRGSAPAGQR